MGLLGLISAPLGFTIAILIIFALSVSAPARVLELVSESEARVNVELAAARRIQTGLLPNDRALAELEFVSHMRPANTDYTFDSFRVGLNFRF